MTKTEALPAIKAAEKVLELKGEVLRFFQQIKKDRRYDIAVVTVQMHRAKKERNRVDSS